MGNLVDRELQELVHMADGNDKPMENGIPLTLTVGGLVVSGNLIPNWQWFQMQADQLADGRTEEEEDAFTGHFRDAYRDLVEQRDEIYLSEEVMEKATPTQVRAVIEVHLPKYLHLKETRTYSGGNALPANGMLWRGKLESVTGWALGITRAQAT